MRVIHRVWVAAWPILLLLMVPCQGVNEAGLRGSVALAPASARSGGGEYFSKESSLNRSEIVRVQQYLRNMFGTERITLKERTPADDSVEVLIGGEFIGVIFRDEDEGEISYAFNMAILEMDLPRVAGVPPD
jgi:hypothetical protein